MIGVDAYTIHPYVGLEALRIDLPEPQKADIRSQIHINLICQRQIFHPNYCIGDDIYDEPLTIAELQHQLQIETDPQKQQTLQDQYIFAHMLFYLSEDTNLKILDVLSQSETFMNVVADRQVNRLVENLISELDEVTLQIKDRGQAATWNEIIGMN